MAEITEWPVERRNAEGKIIEILGNVGDVGLEILSIICLFLRRSIQTKRRKLWSWELGCWRLRRYFTGYWG